MSLVTLTSADGSIEKQFLTHSQAEAWWISLHVSFINFLLPNLALRGQPNPHQLFDLINNVGVEYFDDVLLLNSNVSVDVIRQILLSLGASELFTGL